MNGWTIWKRLAVGFGAVIAITAALGGFVRTQVTAIGGAADAITRGSLPGIDHMSQIDSYVRQNMVNTLRHILTDDPGELAAIENDMSLVTAANDKAYAEYERSIMRPRDRTLFDTVVPARQEYLKLRRELLAVSRQEVGTTHQSMQFYRTRVMPAMEAYINKIREAIQENRAHAEENSRAITGAIGSTRRAILLGVLASLLAGCGLAFYIVRAVTGVLRRSLSQLTVGADQVASTANYVAGSAQSLSQGATEQAASLQETSASMEEVASITRRNADSSHQAASTMAETERLVRDANGAFVGMVGAMTAIKDASQKVSSIIKTIDQLAFQTNILALNAAVEAARAGEAGMGFAVVADEVRNLAQRSAQAAHDTADLIAQSLATADEGHQRVAQVTSAIAAITNSTEQVKALIDQVSAASRQQTQGIEQVSHAITQMERVTHNTAATAEESATASEELSAQAHSVLEVVALLATLVEGTAVDSGRRVPLENRSLPLTT